MLKVVGRIYDPFGFVTPVLFHGKVFVQELWKEELAWDEELPEMSSKK